MHSCAGLRCYTALVVYMLTHAPLLRSVNMWFTTHWIPLVQLLRLRTLRVTTRSTIIQTLWKKIMTIKERTLAARGVYQDTLRSHTGPMKTLRALKSAAQCFFNSRQVENKQELNVATVSQTATKPERKDPAGTNIDERNTEALGMRAELKSELNKRASKTQNGEDAQAEPVATATKPPAPTFDQLIPDSGARLDDQAARDKMKVRPPRRRPPNRNPGRH